jgi:hypothetical protein
VALPGRRADRIISGSRSYYTSSDSSEDETESDADRPEAKPVAPNCCAAKHRKRHLYVVLGDWKKGFSIHKLDVDDGSDCRDLALRPPAYRQAAEWLSHWNFAAMGSKIVAAGAIKREEPGKEGSNSVTLVYNTETAGLSIVPDRLPTALCGFGWFLDAAARGGLYVSEDMSSRSTSSMQYNVYMHHLEEAPSPAFRWGTSDNWVWRSIPSPPAFNMAGWRIVQSIALHPEGGGRTIFVSQTQQWSEPTTGQTYSYDTGSGEWTDHGEWRLPSRRVGRALIYKWPHLLLRRGISRRELPAASLKAMQGEVVRS